jgi:hypothetical protein
MDPETTPLTPTRLPLVDNRFVKLWVDITEERAWFSRSTDGAVDGGGLCLRVVVLPLGCRERDEVIGNLKKK